MCVKIAAYVNVSVSLKGKIMGARTLELLLL